MYPHINLRRCARGLSTSITAGTTGQCALYNDSASAQMLKVWRAQSSLHSANQFYQSFILRGRLSGAGTILGNGIIAPVITGDPQPPGQIDTRDATTIVAADFALVTTNSEALTVPSIFPMWVLTPGYSLVMESDTSTTGVFQGLFFYEWCFPEDLISPTIGNPAIDRLSRP